MELLAWTERLVRQLERKGFGMPAYFALLASNGALIAGRFKNLVPPSGLAGLASQGVLFRRPVSDLALTERSPSAPDQVGAGVGQGGGGVGVDIWYGKTLLSSRDSVTSFELSTVTVLAKARYHAHTQWHSSSPAMSPLTRHVMLAGPLPMDTLNADAPASPTF